jgi:hypothetical protein
MTALTPAERILKSLGIEAPGEIDLEAIAWTRGAVVSYRPLDRCEATIVGSKRKAVIAVNSRSPPERRRFSLAHELGHWHHHKGRMLFCGGRDVCNFANGPLDPERQADAFASDLILPNYLLGPRFEGDRRGVFGEPDGDALQDDGREPLSDRHRLLRQDQTMLVRTGADDPAMVVSYGYPRPCDLRGEHAVRWRCRGELPEEDAGGRVIQFQGMRSFRG